MTRREEQQEAMTLLSSIIEEETPSEEEYYHNQQDALADFLSSFRFSFVHNGVTDCYSQLAKARAAQTKLGVNLPIWDAQEQVTIPAL